MVNTQESLAMRWEGDGEQTRTGNSTSMQTGVLFWIHHFLLITSSAWQFLYLSTTIGCIIHPRMYVMKVPVKEGITWVTACWTSTCLWFPCYTIYLWRSRYTCLHTFWGMGHTHMVHVTLFLILEDKLLESSNFCMMGFLMCPQHLEQCLTLLCVQ